MLWFVLQVYRISFSTFNIEILEKGAEFYILNI